MQPALIASLENQVASLAPSAASARITGSQRGSAFAGIVHEILQRPESVAAEEGAPSTPRPAAEQKLVASLGPSAASARTVESPSEPVLAGMIHEILQKQPQSIAPGEARPPSRSAAEVGNLAKSPGRAWSTTFALAIPGAPVSSVPNSIIAPPQPGHSAPRVASSPLPLDWTVPATALAAPSHDFADLTEVGSKADSSATPAATEALVASASQAVVAPSRDVKLVEVTAPATGIAAANAATPAAPARVSEGSSGRNRYIPILF